MASNENEVQIGTLGRVVIPATQRKALSQAGRGDEAEQQAGSQLNM